MKIITVTHSPFLCDYGTENDPPWSYSVPAFKNWVWEVLLDMGKAGHFPKTIEGAIHIAEGRSYTIEVSDDGN